jgi:AcrR family transcriptional regulator
MARPSEWAAPSRRQHGAAPHPDASARRERRKREVHDRIRSAAVALFDSRGYDTTKIDDICERADVAQKTFFNHFPTRQHLVREIADAFLDKLLAVLDAARRQTGTRARLVAFFLTVANEAELAGPMHRELIMEVIRVSHVDRAEPEQTRRLHRAFRTLILEGKSAGDVSSAHGVDVLTEMTVGAFTTIMLNWVTLDRYPLRERARETAHFLGNAICL